MVWGSVETKTQPFEQGFLSALSPIQHSKPWQGPQEGGLGNVR